MKKIIYAKFSSQCAETGQTIKKGDRMVYDTSSKKCYTIASKKAVEFMNSPADQDAADMVQANEYAYFDTFCQNNNL
jgi:hypothetical protein